MLWSGPFVNSGLDQLATLPTGIYVLSVQGDSGGPVLNEVGEQAGIITFGAKVCGSGPSCFVSTALNRFD